MTKGDDVLETTLFLHFVEVSEPRGFENKSDKWSIQSSGNSLKKINIKKIEA